MEGLCRVCGSQGNYDIFGKIPRFLNTDRRDVWKNPVYKMVSDVTGIPVSTSCCAFSVMTGSISNRPSFQISKNDGLPERICGLCISYLKHAVSFRNRAVQTRLSLVSAAFVSMKGTSEDFGIISDNQGYVARKIKQRPSEEGVTTPEKRTDKTAVAGELVSSTTATLLTSHKLQRFFDYEEKTFVEDDMTQFDAEVGIEISHPEIFRERKCGFCLKRFMLEDTYDDHLDDCIFRTLLEFIKDSNYIVRLKDEVAISNHEFIRRMVFAIQRVNKAIKGMHLPASVGLLVDQPLTEPVPNSGTPGNFFPTAPPKIAPKVNEFFQRCFRNPQRPPPPIGHGNHSPLFPYPPPKIISDRVNSFRNGSPRNPHQRQSPHRQRGTTSSSNNRSSSGSIILQTPSPVHSSASDSSGMRRVVCKFCDKTFLTITHLDGHMIKEHTQ